MENLPVSLMRLAENCPAPLYVVGGYVRDFLIGGVISDDIDIAAAIPVEVMKSVAQRCGLSCVAEYKRTGTAVFADGRRRLEYTRFRTDTYATGGAHAPSGTEFTDDIRKDAIRRDFKCNAVYYDIKGRRTVDPLGGAEDIKNGIIDTVLSPEKVFCSDGLRLMRLARFAAELNFKPMESVLSGAKRYAANIKDVAPERIYEELKKILCSDVKYPFSDKCGHYTAFKILNDTGVLDFIFPEITAGRGMSQRNDFHKYDVCEHSLRTLKYAEKDVRLAAFLHDVGKPYCKNAFGTYRGHAEEGEKIATEILERFKADAGTERETAFLVRWHMFDLDCGEPETAVRAFIAENEKYLNKLLQLRQADYSAGKDDFSVCPAVAKWKRIYAEMKADGTPFSLKELKISAADLTETGFTGKEIGDELAALFRYATEDPDKNRPNALSARARADFKRLRRRT